MSEKAPEDGWQFFHPFFAKTLIDGTKSSARLLLRRKINGVWQYRDPTPEEVQHFNSIDAW